MADEIIQSTPAETEADKEVAAAKDNVAAARLNLRSSLWWGILLVYLYLFTSTGYLAFITKDSNPALDFQVDKLSTAVNDETTKAFLIKVLEDEDAEHDKKADLATQSFHIVLGALLGFLSASAVSKVTDGDKA
jgi:hypothetical protein